jgi:hypothetical protein
MRVEVKARMNLRRQDYPQIDLRAAMRPVVNGYDGSQRSYIKH